MLCSHIKFDTDILNLKWNLGTNLDMDIFCQFLPYAYTVWTNIPYYFLWFWSFADFHHQKWNFLPFLSPVRSVPMTVSLIVETLLCSVWGHTEHTIPSFLIMFLINLHHNVNMCLCARSYDVIAASSVPFYGAITPADSLVLTMEDVKNSHPYPHKPLRQIFFLLFIYFTSFREQDEAYMNSLRWSMLVGLEPAYTACESPTLPLYYHILC